MARSQLAVRILFTASSLFLVLLTVARAPAPIVVAAVLLALLTLWAAVHPESSLVTVLVAGHALNWVASVPIPNGTAGWVWLLVAALLVLVLHLSAGLAAGLPPSVAVPPVAARRWSARGGAVAALTVPVWAVAALTAEQGLNGEVARTYAALAAACVLALAVWLLSRDPST